MLHSTQDQHLYVPSKGRKDIIHESSCQLENRVNLNECYRIGKKQNREDHKVTSNLHGLMMIVENIP